MNSVDKTARIAGFLYLLYFPVHIISDAVCDSFIAPDDAAATAGNILARPATSFSSQASCRGSSASC